MTNDAFRALVQQGGKTTKEIARDAVEQEFRRNQKKRRRNQDSSDEEDDDAKNKHNNKTKNAKHHVPSETETETAISSLQYRDRAKERREGKIEDESQLDLMTTATTLDAEMTKFLGGDEAHTHLVRGLDVTLARKIKREMKEQEKKRTEKRRAALLRRGQPLLLLSSVQTDHDLDEIVSDTLADTKAQDIMDEESVIIESASQAKEKIKQWTGDDVATSLGREMLAFLKQQYLPQQPISTNHSQLTVGPAGLAIQRSYYTFSCLGHPGDVRNSWEVPDEHTSMDMHNVSGDAEIGGGGVLSDPSLLHKIHQAFDRYVNRPSPTVVLPTTRSTTQTSPFVNETDQEAAVAKTRPVDHQEDAEDSDDDIFADAGDYIPPSVETHLLNTGTTPTAKVSSAFADLLPQRPNDEDDNTPIPDFNIIAKIAQKSRVQGSVKMGGDFSQYDGDYGEDGMDVDFAGQMEDEEDDGTKKKKKKEESTMASREYGKRGKPLKDTAIEE